MVLAGHALSPRAQRALAVAPTTLTLTVDAPPGRTSPLFPFAGDYTPIYIAPGDGPAGPATFYLLVKQSSNVHVAGHMIRLRDDVWYHGAFFQASDGALVRRPGALGQAHHVVRVALPYNTYAPARVTMVRPGPNEMHDVQTLVVPRASWNRSNTDTFRTFVGNVTVGVRQYM